MTSTTRRLLPALLCLLTALTFTSSAHAAGVIDSHPGSATNQTAADFGFHGNAVAGQTLIAGSGATAYSGENVPATQASVYGPFSLTSASDGTVYIANAYSLDGGNVGIRITKVDGTTGLMTTVAGGGTSSSGYASGPAVGAYIGNVFSIALSHDEQTLYVADSSSANRGVRAVNLTSHTISTLSGTAGATTNAIAVSPDGDYLYFQDIFAGTTNKVGLHTGTKTVVASGLVAVAFSGMAVSPDGLTLYVTEQNANRVRAIDLASGNVTTIAGTGTRGNGLDGVPAASSALSSPYSLATGPDNALYIADQGSNRVRRVDLATNIISTVATTSGPTGLTVSPTGTVYFSSYYTNQVNRINSAGPTQCSLDGAAFADCTSPLHLTGLSEGRHTFTARQGSSDTGQTYTWLVDLTAPSITISAPAERQHLLLGATLTPDFTCADPQAGSPAGASGVASCTGPDAPTGELGPHSFTVNGADNVGNRSARTVAYVVDPPKYSDLIAAQHPLAFWDLDAPLGAGTFADASGHGNAGSYHGAVATHRGDVPVFCQSADADAACETAGEDRAFSVFFPGRDAYGAVNDIPAPTDAYTLQAWVKPATGADMMITGQGGAGQLFIHDGKAALRQVQDTVYGAGEDANVPAGEWSLITGTWDGQTTRVYVNGREVASSTTANKPPSGTGTFYIGYGDQAPWMHGNLAKVVYLDHAETGAQIATLYTVATAREHASLGTGELDTAAPTVTLTTPAQGSTYNAPKVPAAAFACTDLDGHADVAACTAVVDGQPLANGGQLPRAAGPHTVSVTATDQAGLRTTVTHTYTVGDYAHVIGADDPLAYWRLGDAADSSVMADASGNHQDGVYVNDNTQGPTGIAGDGDATRQMLGRGGYGYLSGLDAPQHGYTVEAWADPADTGDMSVLTAAGQLYLKDGHYVFQQGTTVLTDPHAAHAGAWADLVGTWDGQTATLYVDGVRVDSAESTKAPSGAPTVYVGYGDKAPWMRGNLDEVAYYGSALTAQRVWEHFLADPPAEQGTGGTREPTGDTPDVQPTPPVTPLAPTPAQPVQPPVSSTPTTAPTGTRSTPTNTKGAKSKRVCKRVMRKLHGKKVRRVVCTTPKKVTHTKPHKTKASKSRSAARR